MIFYLKFFFVEKIFFLESFTLELRELLTPGFTLLKSCFQMAIHKHKSRVKNLKTNDATPLIPNGPSEASFDLIKFHFSNLSRSLLLDIDNEQKTYQVLLFEVKCK